MKLETYFPTFRNVLLELVVEEKTNTGIYIPYKNSISGDMFYRVVKIGKSCEEVQINDLVRLDNRVSPQTVPLIEQGKSKDYYQVQEINIVGISR